ncbi:MAG: hypothetical protein Q8922_07045 [Bacteroidota bacterium]|nr:hypothetical protein [Bacteroidota bacterium]MDP4234019.1 hypothetical protein [Bacteroidota bacterium]MDP4242885.1 hypothetical protein [Bacteroidota bacterium]MDP4287676.1 hypothetical protein [Bacteroidota bacterium]
MRIFVFLTLAALTLATSASVAQRAKKHSAPKQPAAEDVVEYHPLHLLGIRPGISIDSIRSVIYDAGAPIREVKEDTLTHSYSDATVHVFVVDSIICRLTYMRMVFVVDASNRLRRLSITPRVSSIAVGASDDVENVLLLYFGQTWGKPELILEPPLAHFRWKTGNIEVRGFIRRGYPVWVMEG